MPELPEVETTIRQLKAVMLKQQIVSFSVSNKGGSQLNAPSQVFADTLVGAMLLSLDRVGKWMLFDFGNKKIVGHLRMSGRYKVEGKKIDHPHNRFQIYLANKTVINYLDQRRFGTFHLVQEFSDHPALSKLGKDALDPSLSTDYLLDRLSALRKPIYSALLDQNVVAGLGNIYVNEILHAAQIHPLTPSYTIDTSAAQSIISHTRRILQLALDYKGTTLVDKMFHDPNGASGEFTSMLKVYGKRNTEDVVVLKIGGRSVFVDRNLKL